MRQRRKPPGPVTITVRSSVARQVHDRGLFVLWRDAPRSSQRQGLAFVASACPEPDCTCLDMHLDGFVIDDSVRRVSWVSDGIKITGPSGAARGRDQEIELTALVELESGEVQQRTPCGDEEGEGASKARGSDPAGELLDWVRGCMDGELLEHLHRAWMRSKGRAMGSPREEIDLRDRVPGDLVGFEEIFDDERGDQYIHGGGRYWADTYFCLDPDCSCREVRVVFSAASDEPGLAVGAMVVALNPPGGDAAYVARQEVEGGAPEALVGELWQLFCARHQVADYLQRRLARIGALDLRRLWRSQGRRRPVVRPRAPGRNEPCPCGSGKKYKRCCLDRPAV